MKFKHKRTGAVVEVINESTLALYKQSNVFEAVAEKVELSIDDFTKAELQAQLVDKGIEYNDRETKAELLDKLGEA